MALNYIWSGFFLVGFLAAMVQWIFLGDTEIFKKIVDGTFDSAKVAVMDIALPLAGIMTLWLGLMNVGEKAGAIGWLAKIIGPFFARIFPGVPREHPANGHMVMNFSANMLGLDNAATPLGLKAMESLQELNPNKEEATDAQIMFLVIQTSGLTVIPLSIMAQRSLLGAADPTDILLAWRGGTTAACAGLVYYFANYLNKAEIELVSKVSANLILFSIIVTFILAAMRKKINVYEAFIEGAKGGIQTSLTIIPYLVGMLVAISVVRNSGVLGMIVGAVNWFLRLFGWDTAWTDALPTALMKPLSGSGSKAMTLDIMKTHGVDSFAGRLASIMQGAADTTFYIIALYFGSVGIRKTRYAVGYGLLADVAGMVAAVFVAYLFFG